MMFDVDYSQVAEFKVVQESVEARAFQGKLWQETNAAKYTYQIKYMLKC